MNFRCSNWAEDGDELLDHLRSIANEKYKNFSKKLVPGEFEMIGVNFPTLKKIAKEIYAGDYELFLKLEHRNVFEIKFLQGQVIANIKDVQEYERRLVTYLPIITDWSLCDSFIAASKVIKKDPDRFFDLAQKLINEKDEFRNRVGFVILLDYFVDENYYHLIYDAIGGYESSGYYADMALAWLLAELYIEFPDDTFNFLKNGDFTTNVIKYTIRKVRDSYRVSDEHKNKIKRLA